MAVRRNNARLRKLLDKLLAADTTYGNGKLLQWLDERGIAAYIRVKENPAATTDTVSPRYGQSTLRVGNRTGGGSWMP